MPDGPQFTLDEARRVAQVAVAAATAHGKSVPAAAWAPLRDALAAHPDDLDLLFSAFQFQFRSGQLDEAESFTRRRLALSPPNSAHAARALCNLGLIAHQQNRFTEAERLLTEALGVDRTIGNMLGVARDLGNLALVPESLGDLARAEALNLEALAVARSLSGPGAEDIAAGKLSNLGDIALARGRRDEAWDLWQQARAIFNRLGITKWDKDFEAREAKFLRSAEDSGRS